jgi:hypothetical protein
MSSIFEDFVKGCGDDMPVYSEWELLRLTEAILDIKLTKDLQSFVSYCVGGSWAIPPHLAYLIREELRRRGCNTNTCWIDYMLDMEGHTAIGFGHREGSM